MSFCTKNELPSRTGITNTMLHCVNPKIHIKTYLGEKFLLHRRISNASFLISLYLAEVCDEILGKNKLFTRNFEQLSNLLNKFVIQIRKIKVRSYRNKIHL